MPKMSFEEYKKAKDLKESYQQAALIQENFALSIAPQVGVNPATKKQNEGFVAVQDVIAKIDAMTRMFDAAIQENSSDPSAQKVSEIIVNLYELAAIKLNEAKKRAQDYMNKITGVPETPEMPEDEPEPEETGSMNNPMNQDDEAPEPEEEEEDETPPENSKFTLRSRGPMESPEDERAPVGTPPRPQGMPALRRPEGEESRF
jgi:chemotaxis protein histidine kinase CheA